MNHIDTGLMKSIIDPVINHASKQGDDIRYEPAFEQVEAEIAKLTSIHKENKPDWQLVKKQSLDLLVHQTKDLRLLCWLLFSYLKDDLLDNVIPAISLLFDFLKTYQEYCYPNKSRQQIAILIWFLDRIEVENNTKLETQHSDYIRDLKTQLEKLDELLDELFKEEAPNLRSKVQVLSHIQARAKAEQQHHQEKETPKVSESQPMRSSSIIPTRVPITETNMVNETDLLRVVRSIQEGVRPLMNRYLQNDVLDPRAYLLTRSIAWLQVLTSPPANAEGITTIKPLSTNKLQEYQKRIAEKDYLNLLPELEVSLSKAPFWFDGHYLCACVLEGIGQPELAEFNRLVLELMLKKFPAFMTLKFDDGSSFVSIETQNWLSAKSSDPMTGVALPNSDVAVEPWQLALADASQMVQQDQSQLSVALKQFQVAMQTAQSMKEKIYWLFSSCLLCQQQNKHELANIFFNQMNHFLEQFDLVSWDPDFAASIYTTWKKTLEKNNDKNQKNRLEEIKEKLFRLDITKAF